MGGEGAKRAEQLNMVKDCKIGAVKGGGREPREVGDSKWVPMG